MGFPGGSDGNESACNVGDLGSIPGLGRSPGGGHGNPLQYSCLKDPHGPRSLRAAVRGFVMSQTQLTKHTHTDQESYWVTNQPQWWLNPQEGKKSLRNRVERENWQSFIEYKREYKKKTLRCRRHLHFKTEMDSESRRVIGVTWTDGLRGKQMKQGIAIKDEGLSCWGED